MIVKVLNAWFSYKTLMLCGGDYAVYSDTAGNQFAVTEVTQLGTQPITRQDDLVYLGHVVKWVKSCNGYVIPPGILTYPLEGSLAYQAAEFQAPPFYKSPSKQVVSSAKAINDYVCPACRNEKCSKTEKSCWKCGFQFKH